MAVQNNKEIEKGDSDLVTPDMVADYLLAASRERGEVLTNLKLQKLLYYAQAWHLAIEDKPLFGEDFEAWVHGPVLPSQYQRFKRFTWKPIMSPIEKPVLASSIERHLDEILAVFGTDSAIALERMTHSEAPWKEARGSLAEHESSCTKISKDRMKSFYRSLAETAST